MIQLATKEMSFVNWPSPIDLNPTLLVDFISDYKYVSKLDFLPISMQEKIGAVSYDT